MKGSRFQAKSLIFDEPFSVFSNLASKIAKMTPRGFIRSSRSVQESSKEAPRGSQEAPRDSAKAFRRALKRAKYA